MATSSLKSPVRTANLSNQRYRFERRLSRGSIYFFLILICILCMMPFFFMFSGSLMAEGEIFSLTPHFWPKQPNIENYFELFRRFNFIDYMRNSVIIAISQTAGVLFFTSLAGYIFAKRRFPGRNGLFLFVLATTLLPGGQITMIPFYLLMVQLHWINTYWPLIIPWWAPALSIFLMRQYISVGIPDEITDSARIDGCGLFGTYWRIVLPLSVPGLVVIGIQNFISVWNDFLYGLLVLQRDDMRTVTVALTNLSRQTQQATLYGPLFAGIVLATLPTILLYFIFQRRLTQGLLSGAIRG